MSQPHPDDTWQSRYGTKIWIKSLPRNQEVYFEVLDGASKGKCFQISRKEFLKDFVKVEET